MKDGHRATSQPFYVWRAITGGCKGPLKSRGTASAPGWWSEPKSSGTFPSLEDLLICSRTEDLWADISETGQWLQAVFRHHSLALVTDREWTFRVLCSWPLICRSGFPLLYSSRGAHSRGQIQGVWLKSCLVSSTSRFPQLKVGKCWGFKLQHVGNEQTIYPVTRDELPSVFSHG